MMNVPIRTQLGRGRLAIGDRCMFGFRQAPILGDGGVLLQPRSLESSIEIGQGTILSNNVTVVANQRVKIGRNCRIGDQAVFFDCDFHEISPATRNRSAGRCSPVEIGDNVWIGSRAVVLRGVTIGENSVVAACSVVTKSFPGNVVVGGNPAKFLRQIEPMSS